MDPFNNFPYLDFHTHSMRQKHRKDVMEIISVHLGQEKEYEYYTVGMHPWWTEQSISPTQTLQLEQLLKKDKCLAMGEMGLDNLKGPSMKSQMDILRSLLKIAEEHDKSVVIHCVRAFDQLIQIKKEFPKIHNWCIHGYGRHATLARQLINQGFYLSLMPTMPWNKYEELLKVLPPDRFFLETDSMAEANIVDIYEHVAGILSIEVPDLCRQMNQNAKQFFKR